MGNLSEIEEKCENIWLELFKESEEETIKGKLFWNPTGIPLGNLSEIEEKSKEILCICW